MRQRGGIFFERNFHLVLGDHRPCQRCSQKILVLILRARAQSREDVVAQEFIAQVFHDHFCRAGLMGFFHHGVNVLALAHVGNHGDHVTVIVFFEPRNNDRGIKPPEYASNFSRMIAP